MKRLVLSDQALADLANIATHIETESGSAQVADRFIDEIEARCRKLAALPGTLGIARPDLRPDLRSLAHKTYVIFFSYNDGLLKILTIVHGMRDIDALFPPDAPSE